MRKLFSGMVLAGVMCSAAVWAAGSDELWEMTSRMDMPGMAIPATKQTVCLPRGGAYTPEKDRQDKNCVMTDIKVSGNTTRWKVHCSGKDAMDGSGEMTRTADTMNGTIRMSTRDMQMTQVISGKHIGVCDAAAEKKKIDDKVNTALGEMCAQQVDMVVKSGGYEARMPEAFTHSGQCASSKATVCEKSRNYVNGGGYQEYGVYAKSGGWVAKECAINLEARRTVLCRKAATERKFKFVKEYCPAEAKAFKDEYDKKCQGFGRSYTATGPNDKLCRSLSFWGGRVPGSDGADDGDSAADTKSGKAPDAGKDNPANQILDGAKKLKGMFGL